MSKYNSSGSLLWTEQLGTSSGENSWAVSSDGLGNVYISGHTSGDFGGPNAGLTDAFVAKFSEVIPEPSTLLLGTIAAAGFSLWRKRSTI